MGKCDVGLALKIVNIFWEHNFRIFDPSNYLSNDISCSNFYTDIELFPFYTLYLCQKIFIPTVVGGHRLQICQNCTDLILEIPESLKFVLALKYTVIW